MQLNSSSTASLRDGCSRYIKLTMCFQYYIQLKGLQQTFLFRNLGQTNCVQNKLIEIQIGQGRYICNALTCSIQEIPLYCV